MVWTQIGARIASIRKERNLTRTQFGKIVGVSARYIGMIENGENGLSVDLMTKICHFADVTSDYILFGTVGLVQDKAVLRTLNGLSPEQIQIALDIIKKVAQFVNTEDGNEVLIREIAGAEQNAS